MKNLLFLLLPLLLLSFVSKDSDCDNIAAILKTPEFNKCFQLGKKGEKITLFVKGKLDQKELCELVIIPSGQYIVFAKADFELNVNESRPSDKSVPRIVVWKENNQYHFFETETNRKFYASVKNGKVVGIEMGVF